MRPVPPLAHGAGQRAAPGLGHLGQAEDGTVSGAGPRRSTDPDYRQLWSWILDGATRGTPGSSWRQGPAVARPREENSFLRGDGSLKMARPACSDATPTDHRCPPLGRRPASWSRRCTPPCRSEWLAAEFDIEVVVVLRHPGSVLASWLALDFVDQYVAFEEKPAVRQLASSWDVPLPGPDPLERTIWRIGLLTTALEQALAAHPTVGGPHPRAAVPRSGHRVPPPLRRPGPELERQAEAHLADNDRDGARGSGPSGWPPICPTAGSGG